MDPQEASLWNYVDDLEMGDCHEPPTRPSTPPPHSSKILRPPTPPRRQTGARRSDPYFFRDPSPSPSPVRSRKDAGRLYPDLSQLPFGIGVSTSSQKTMARDDSPGSLKRKEREDENGPEPQSSESDLDSDTNLSPFSTSRNTSFATTIPDVPSISTALPRSPNKSRKIGHEHTQPRLVPPTAATPRRYCTQTDVILRTLADPPPLAINTDLSLDILFGESLTSSLPCRVIAHNPDAQTLIDENHIAFGVQYVLAMGVQQEWWNWGVIRERLDDLEGSNEKVIPTLINTLNSRVVSFKKYSTAWEAVGKQLDLEETAIVENEGSALLMGDYHDHKNWYGGRVQFIGRIGQRKDGTFHIALEPFEMQRSNRLARLLGSRRVIHVKIPQKLLQSDLEGIRKYLIAKFVFCGRVYVPIPPKDGSIYLVEVNEGFQRYRPIDGDEYRLGYTQLLEWINPMQANYKQPVAKWLSRSSGLPLSTSVPVLEFCPENIQFIDDLYPPGVTAKTATTEETLTDGCGFINREALTRMHNLMGYDFLPSAVQGRIGGAKGLWILHPTDNDDIPKIWIRSSQNKVNFEQLHRVNFIFDLLQPSRPFSVGRRHSLSIQPILNLYHNGVPHEVLRHLFTDGLNSEGMKFLEWENPVKLANFMDRLGGVTASRIQRLLGRLESRARGWTGREFDVAEGLVSSNDLFKQEVLESLSGARQTGRRLLSGLPTSNYERAVEMLLANISPHENPELRSCLQHCAQTFLENTISKFNIPLPEGQFLEAYVAVDPLNILEPDELYYQSSIPITDEESGNVFTNLEGDVLLGKYPMRLESDIIKLRAVNRPELGSYKDIVLLSTRGLVSTMSKVSGGDYDGDIVALILTKSIVENFKTKMLSPMPADLIEKNFQRHTEQCSTMVERMRALPTPEQSAAFFKLVVGGLFNPLIGLYSSRHEGAIYHHGYTHPKTVRLAWIFNILLDSGKTGLTLRPDIEQSDKRSPYAPSCFKGQVTNRSKWFILDDLLLAGQETKRKIMDNFVSMDRELVGVEKDQELVALYVDVKKRASECVCPGGGNGVGVSSSFSSSSSSSSSSRRGNGRGGESRCKCGMEVYSWAFSKLVGHADRCHEEWRTIRSVPDQEDEGERKIAKKRRDKLIDELTDKFWNGLAAEVLSGMRITMDRGVEIMVSYLWYQGRYSMASKVGHRVLCDLKARASGGSDDQGGGGGSAGIAKKFGDGRVFAGSFLKAMGLMYGV